MSSHGRLPPSSDPRKAKSNKPSKKRKAKQISLFAESRAEALRQQVEALARAPARSQLFTILR